ncbi:diguanylate cyclase [Rhodoferax sp. AJA081-3]|uniref:sensor domain-containing diguanylate cyclase n=1 Tax=Rhodoferax sp. AJA081-3 TaxID=2752316 RepID=UPI001ADF9EA7|nr:7TM diverse intracellular signaling domain-containing protein [Rhodoferax sp. AJA081-3]QTN27396.1 diguanylate cyclase [Rhodoferax sp. AJA081-3]
MPSLLVRLLVTICCLLAVSGQAANQPSSSAQPVETIVLDDLKPSLQIETTVSSWIDEGSNASIELVAGGIITFKPEPALARYALNKYDTLWIKLRFKRTAGSRTDWTLNLPMPFVDAATLYQTDSAGRWTAQRAGDSVAQGEWHKRGLYPDFEFHLADTASKDIYLQIRNFRQVAVPIRVTAAPQRENQRQLELLGLGLMLGILLSLAALSLLRYLEHRQPIDGWAALFGLLIATTVAQITGVLNAFFWAAIPEIGNYASSFMPVVAVGCTLLFIRNVFVLHVHFHRFDRFLSSVGWGTLASVLAFAVMDRFIADRVSSMVMIFASVVGLGATFLSWHNGSTVGRWLMLALLPQFLALTYMLGETMGLVPLFWQMRYVTSLCVALTVPILLYALSQLTHDRKELVVRANHLPTQDALTGLLTPEVFQTHLEGAVQRAIDHREPLALVMVQVTNHDHIRQAYSDTTAEQCLLRAVVKVQRILRDVDPAGRVGTAQFGLLMEGVTTRQALTERMVKLIGSGLIPLPGLVPEVTLHFQAACVLLHENPLPPERVLDDLRDLLAGMSPNTRRPIRFLEPAPTQASLLETQAPAT